MEQYINNAPFALVIVFLIIGFVFLIKGADFFVDGAAGIAGKLGIPQLIVGPIIKFQHCKETESSFNHHRADDRCNGNIPSGNCSQCDCIIGAQ